MNFMEVLCMRVFSVRKANNMNVSIHRCDWAEHSDIEREYHDHYWGIPVYDEQELFRMLMLEGQQAGLSWKTILDKKEAICEAFDNFLPEALSNYDDEKIKALLQNPKIIRNRLKIHAAIQNANAYYRLCAEHGSLREYLWHFVDHKPIQNHWQTAAEVPVHTELSDRISKDLKRYGFKFVGSTIIYSFMQAVGMVNDHLTGCICYSQNKRSRSMMKKEVLPYVVEKTHDLMKAPSCSQEAKQAAQAWLDAVGTAQEAAETKKYLEELAADIMPIDQLISFAESEAGIQHFGTEMAGKLASHAKEIKAAGAKYCDCPACQAAAAILDKKVKCLLK